MQWGLRGLMGGESWVTSKVHQRIDSLWTPWHTFRVMDRSLMGSEAHTGVLYEAALTKTTDRVSLSKSIALVINFK